MTVTAEVIVDVPTMQTDQPFTYQVPSELEEAIFQKMLPLYLQSH